MNNKRETVEKNFISSWSKLLRNKFSQQYINLYNDRFKAVLKDAEVDLNKCNDISGWNDSTLQRCLTTTNSKQFQ